MALTVNKIPKYKGLVGATKQVQDSSLSDDGSIVSTALDLETTTATKGLILKDRVTSTRYRLKVASGVLSIEAV